MKNNYLQKIKTQSRFSLLKPILLSLLMSFVYFQEAKAQYTTIPDANFEQALIGLGHDDIMDGKVLNSNVINVTTLDVSSNSIANLTGINAFSSLMNLYCSNNQLTSLDVNGLTNLEYLECDGTTLTSLNITGLTNLYSIICNNNSLTSLTLSGLTNLTTLNCSSNQLTSLNVKGLTSLSGGVLNCQFNQLTCIVADTAADKTNWQKDTWAAYGDTTCATTAIPDANFEQALIDLGYDNIIDGKVFTDVVKEITYLELYDRGITNLTGIAAFSALTTLNCYYNNQLTSLDVSGLTNLTTLHCYQNSLTSLNVSGLTNLNHLSCGFNSLTNLNVSGLTNLSSFYCENNSLTQLDLTTNTKLVTIDASNNSISGIDLRNNTTNTISLTATGNTPLSSICKDSADTVSGSWDNSIVPTYSAKPTGSATQTFCNSAKISNLAATGTAIKWYATATGGTALASTVNLVNNTTYYASQTVGNCEGTLRLAVKALINVTPVPTAAAQTFCNAGTVANLVATGTTIKWYLAATGGTALAGTTALSTRTYYASQTLNACESATRTAVSVTVNVTAVPTATAAQTFCYSGTVANLVATGTDIKWYAAATGGTALAGTTALVTGTTYYATQTLNACESATRKAVSVTVNETAAPTGSAQAFCNTGTVANLTATGTAIKWYSVATGGTSLVSTTVLATGTYYASQTLNGCESATRAAVSVTVNTTAAPTATAQTFCNAATVANLVATGTAIKWYSAATGGTALASTTALATSTYYASQTLNACESTTRKSVSVTVNVTPKPTASAQTFCKTGTVAGLVATGTVVKWYSAATGGTALESTTALATGTYYASQTLNACESATRTAVSVTINTTDTAAPTASAQSFCNTGTVANLVATGTAIKWYLASTGGTALAGTTVLTTRTYYASQTVNTCESVTRKAVSVTVNVTPKPTASAQAFCMSGTVANLVATGTAIKWYLAATGGTALASTTALSTRTYYASQTLNSCESTARTTVSVTVNTTATAAPTAAAQKFCMSGKVADLVAAGTSIKWYLASTGGTALSSTTALSTRTYYASQTITACESTTRKAVSVTVNTTATAAPTASAQAFCKAATVADLIATGTDIKWYTAATGDTAALESTTALGTGTYYASQTVNACESVSRTAVSVTVNITPAPSAASQTFCKSGVVANLVAAGTAIKWYLAATGGTALTGTTALSTRTYYASQTVSGCESATRKAVSVMVNTTATPAPTASAQTFCNTATVANLVATGTAIKWYSTSSGTTAALASNTVLGTGTYYASQTINGCVSATRTAVSVKVNVTAAPTASAQTFTGTATVANLVATGTAIKWYLTATGGTALASTTALSTRTYYASQTLNSCESATRKAVSVTVSAGLTTEEDHTQSKEIVTPNEETALLKVYPNPFASTFKLDLTSVSKANVELVVYDVSGNVVEWLTVKAANINTVELGSNYPLGLYIVILKQGSFTKTFRVLKNSN